MRSFLLQLDQQIIKAAALARVCSLPKSYKRYSKILFCGMGGSAISGDIVKSLIRAKTSCPFTVYREVGIPNWVDRDTLAVFSSYSGNTREVLENFNIEDFARCGGRRPDTVTLTTLHSSKGREFAVVIIPGLEEGRLPGFYATSAGALAEARRVFYVGITRAKDAIYLLYSGWYENRFGRKFSNGPSPFIFELQEHMEHGGRRF